MLPGSVRETEAVRHISILYRIYEQSRFCIFASEIEDILFHSLIDLKKNVDHQRVECQQIMEAFSKSKAFSKLEALYRYVYSNII